MSNPGSSSDSFGAKGTLDVDGRSYEIYRLSAVEGDGLDVETLPYSLKVLLEKPGSDLRRSDSR